MSITTSFDKPSIQGAARVVKRERSFELSLPALVTGIDASGNEFKEHSDIASISAQEAVFWLDSGVTIGSKLNLSLEIPKTFLLESNLNLEISGRVCFVRLDQKSGKKQLISLRLDKNYKINSLP